MAEKIENKNVFSLFEVARSIQKTISERYKSSFWVKAEIHKLNHYIHSGHAYPELVEKKEGKTIAEMRSIIWRDDFNRIDTNFKKILKEPLKDGITVLFNAKISFDPKYGLTLIISDIDPSYSLGELEREKHATIEKLKAEGIFDRNKKQLLPLLPKRLAIISVITSKGYSDFMNIINANPRGYKFFHVLFPALLQGEKAISSIKDQLNNISKIKEKFDAVAIIRGGGGDVGLSCYNDYSLSKAIALFPLPVFTGIGHSTNETVSELVSFKNAITPTELAGILLQKFDDFSLPVLRAEEIITQRSKRLLQEKNLQLVNAVRYFRSVSKGMLQNNKNFLSNQRQSLIRTSLTILEDHKDDSAENVLRLNNQLQLLFKHQQQQLSQLIFSVKKETLTNTLRTRTSVNQFSDRIKRSVPTFIKSESKELLNLEKITSSLDPVNVLKRGYSITFVDGKLVRSIKDVKPGDLINTRVADGEIASDVRNSKRQ